MSTATLKRIDDDVLAALRSIEWNSNASVLTCGQLDRKVYERTNKVLESLGGKWNRKAKAHLFDGDAQDELEAVIESGGYVDRKQALGFFETPDELADEVVRLAQIESGMLVLEPSAGTGQLVRAVRRACENTGILAVEVDPKHADKLMATGAIVSIDDFLQTREICEVPGKFHRVVMNPPFARQADVDHVLYAWKFLRPGGRLVSIMSPGWTFRTNRKSVDFKAFVDAHGHWRAIEGGAFKQSGTMVNSCIVALDKPGGGEQKADGAA